MSRCTYVPRPSGGIWRGRVYNKDMLSSICSEIVDFAFLPSCQNLLFELRIPRLFFDLLWHLYFMTSIKTSDIKVDVLQTSINYTKQTFVKSCYKYQELGLKNQ